MGENGQKRRQNWHFWEGGGRPPYQYDIGKKNTGKEELKK